jgi:hypothetical protein
MNPLMAAEIAQPLPMGGGMGAPGGGMNSRDMQATQQAQNFRRTTRALEAARP